MDDDAITEFQGGYFFLSNFYKCEVELNGMKFPTLEHAYQAAKSLDYAERDTVRRRQTPKAAKDMGQGIKRRRDWEAIKVKVMEHLVRDKFTRNADLRRKLLATGDRLLVEGNRWGDSFWGMVKRESGMVGHNHLGEILMKIRAELRDTTKRNILV